MKFDNMTRVDDYTWRLEPELDSLQPLEALIDALREGSQRDLLFRGQRDAGWSINSTLARSEETQNQIRTPEGIELAYKRFYLDQLARVLPSDELQRSRSEDKHYELHRRMQQHPEDFDEDCLRTGTLLIDWSRSFKVALAFACDRPSNDGLSAEGVLYLLDPQKLTPWFWEKPLIEAFRRLFEEAARGGFSIPALLVHPKLGQGYLRVARQDPVYIVQCDITQPLDQAFLSMASDACSAEGDSAGPLQRVLIPGVIEERVRALLAAQGITIDWLLESHEPDACATATVQTPRNR
jgi:hypothetical protein